MSANGISTLPTKEARQKAKLNLAANNRATSSSIASTHPVADDRNTYDITQLPTQYSGNAIVDNPNVGGLTTGRPWI